MSAVCDCPKIETPPIILETFFTNGSQSNTFVASLPLVLKLTSLYLNIFSFSIPTSYQSNSVIFRLK